MSLARFAIAPTPTTPDCVPPVVSGRRPRAGKFRRAGVAGDSRRRRLWHGNGRRPWRQGLPCHEPQRQRGRITQGMRRRHHRARLHIRSIGHDSPDLGSHHPQQPADHRGTDRAVAGHHAPRRWRCVFRPRTCWCSTFACAPAMIRTARIPDNRDALKIQGSAEKPVKNVVIDHCSFSWSIDEVASVWGPARQRHSSRTTSSRSRCNDSLHPQHDGTGRMKHGYGVLLGYERQRRTHQHDRQSPGAPGGTQSAVARAPAGVRQQPRLRPRRPWTTTARVKSAAPP